MFALSKAKLLSIMTIGFRETAHYSQKAAIRFWVQHQQQLLYILAVLIGLLLVLPWGWLVLLGYAGLGILSTIGLGTGVHTRLLFLWPMIAAEGLSDRSFLSVMWRVLPRSIAHGIGASVGELPPYYMSQSLVSRLDLDNNSMYTWTVNYVRDYGAWMVFGFAIWPNTFFDMCGIACGVTGISVQTFLVATIGGKALVRAPITAALIVSMQRSMIPTSLEPFVDTYLRPLLQHQDDGIGGYHVVVATVTVIMLYVMVRDVAMQEKTREESKKERQQIK